MTDSIDALGERIREFSAQLAAGTCHLLDMVREFDQREGWAVDGVRSCAHWLNWQCGIGLNAAREKLRVAHALPEVPAIHAAFASGEVSYSKVRAMTRVATPENQDYLLMIARHGTAAHVEKLVRQYRRVLRLEALAEANARHATRALDMDYDEDGMLVIRGRLTPEDGARFQQAIEAVVEAMGAEGAEDTEDVSPENCYAARRADALVRLAATGADTEVVVHVDAAVLADDAAPGRAEIEHGPALVPETVRRLACDCAVVALAEDENGDPLNVGRRTRSIAPALRRALRARDQGCRFPGCTHTRWLHGHHLTHWSQGGETSLVNTALLCAIHHRLVHEGGFGVERRAGGELVFTRPDGTRIAALPPPPRLHAAPVDAIRASNRARGQHIDADTGRCLWDGVPMDEAMAVDGLVHPWRGKLQ